MAAPSLVGRAAGVVEVVLAQVVAVGAQVQQRDRQRAGSTSRSARLTWRKTVALTFEKVPSIVPIKSIVSPSQPTGRSRVRHSSPRGPIASMISIAIVATLTATRPGRGRAAPPSPAAVPRVAACQDAVDGEGGDHGRGRRPRGPPLQPGQGLLPGARPHQARSRAVLRRRRRGGLPAAARAADDAEALRRRGRRASSSSRSGCPKTAPEWLETATVKFPSGRSATELVANDAAHLVWAVNLGVIDFNPWPARRADLDHPDELRVDLDPTPEVGFDEVRQVALRRPRGARATTGCVGYPKTSGSRGHPRQRPHRAELGLHRGAPGRAGARARGRAPGPGAGDLEVVEGGAPRRLRRLQPERARPHGRLGLLGPAGRRRPRLDPARVGRGPRRRPGRADDSTTVPGAARRARRPGGGDRRRAAARSSRCSSSPRATRREGLGDAPWPPHFRKQKGEPQAGAAEPGEGVARPTGRAGRSCSPRAPCPRASAGSSSRGGCGRRATWSKVTSITSSGRSATHSRSRSAAQRLGSAEPRSPVS